MKYRFDFRIFFDHVVTSYAEVWIEISMLRLRKLSRRVTSYAEVWIEILYRF